MGLNDTPSSERVHIAIFGKRNAGKSSLINCITNQNISIVSDVLGTTTDPVYKSMELLPIGPVVMIDTPGLDDEGELGKERVKKSFQVLAKTDIAILVLEAGNKICGVEEDLLKTMEEKKLPYLVVVNKSEILSDEEKKEIQNAEFFAGRGVFVSSLEKTGIEELKNRIGQLANVNQEEKKIVGDLLSPEDVVVLVIPIDDAAPKGRLILPQQQVIRDLLESQCICMVTKETELVATLGKLKDKPKMVITDSQAFARVSKDVPEDILLTSFSILFARYKGNLRDQVLGAVAISKLNDGDKILISEGCTHHRQCGDIGTEKIPNWLKKFTKKDVKIEFTSGTEFPQDLSGFKVILHCGGCMLNEKEMQHRLQVAKTAGIPMTNYGVAIAYMNGILERTLRPFEEEHRLVLR